MNKQSNTYTVIYIIILVVVVGAALSFTAMGLKDKQQENIDADKMRQILAAALITPQKSEVVADFHKYLKEQFIVNSSGQKTGDDAFAVNVALESKKPADKRLLPVYVIEKDQAQGPKYVLPVYGAGLWGPIWGYVAFDKDGTTIYGAFFAHQGETPGLGAEIEKPAFSDQFQGKQVFKNGQFMPIAVVKNGLKPTGGEDYVDGISGGTITSKGVGAMIDHCLTPYKAFLETLTGSHSAAPSQE